MPARRPFALCSLALAACAGAPVPEGFGRLLAESPEDSPARLWLDGDRVVGAAVAVGPGALPAAVRTAVDAVAPGGELTFQGREWGRRGEGFRVEKRYAAPVAHVRTALIAADGTVLERAHSVPLADAPQDVLAAAMRVGPRVLEVLIVSGPQREEHWQCTVADRIGRTHVAVVGLDGALLRTLRHVAARIDVATGASPR